MRDAAARFLSTLSPLFSRRVSRGRDILDEPRDQSDRCMYFALSVLRDENKTASTLRIKVGKGYVGRKLVDSDQKIMMVNRKFSRQ